jgi:predicted deacylase
VYLSTQSQGVEDHDSNDFHDEKKKKLRVWIQGGVHGNEPAGDQAVLALLGKMDADQAWTASLLERMDIILFPRYNPDGVSYFQRDLASNLDSNREHTKLARKQSRDIKRLFSSFSPHIAVDMHEFTGTRLTAGHYKHGSKGKLPIYLLNFLPHKKTVYA